MRFVDTHAHIHSEDYELDADEVIKEALAAGVEKIICVGTDESDSERAVAFVENRDSCFASVGLHPHDAKLGQAAFDALSELADQPKVVAIGECGLDYYYNHSRREEQEVALRFQIELARKHGLPLIFHVRESFDRFFAIIDEYPDIQGVVHSFTSNIDNLHRVLDRGLLVAFNGIMTFTEDQDQLAAVRACPLEKMMIETDAPFLTPVPKRGKVNISTNVVLVAEFLAKLRNESLEELSRATSRNAHALFGL